ncbi:MAG: hypothetical protein MZV65_11415 [Chromatiales bacterium]|nr:hypothetical protein [Chromatiales bacterium]
MNIDQIANAIEQDAGEALPGLRESLAEMRDGLVARTTTPEQMLVRSARQALGLSQPQFADLIQTPEWQLCVTGSKGDSRRRARCCVF